MVKKLCWSKFCLEAKNWILSHLIDKKSFTIKITIVGWTDEESNMQGVFLFISSLLTLIFCSTEFSLYTDQDFSHSVATFSEPGPYVISIRTFGG